jgi:hypothetical protein
MGEGASNSPLPFYFYNTMDKHQLALDIPDTLSKCILRVVDASIYSKIGTVDCTRLEITPPGFTTAYVVENLQQGFLTNLSTCDVGLQTANCGNTYNNFSDGVYIVKYSINPNDQVYVEYNHLRITDGLNAINDLLCCLDLQACDPPGPVREKLKEIQLMTTLLKAAKAKVEYCHTPKHGMDMYNYVMKRLNKLACGCGCSSCN